MNKPVSQEIQSKKFNHTFFYEVGGTSTSFHQEKFESINLWNIKILVKGFLSVRHLSDISGINRPGQPQDQTLLSGDLFSFEKLK